MLLNQILVQQKNTPLRVIHERCSVFLTESEGLPLYKNLSCQYDDIQKIKARRRKAAGQFVETFNSAFGDNLAQRAIFANGQTSFRPHVSQTQEPFYIFPINGYRFLYSSEVDNSSEDYKQVVETVFEQFGSDKGLNIVTDLLKFAYKQNKLTEGITKGAEIVFYDIPFYYAVRVEPYHDYERLLSTISN